MLWQEWIYNYSLYDVNDDNKKDIFVDVLISREVGQN